MTLVAAVVLCGGCDLSGSSSSGSSDENVSFTYNDGMDTGDYYPPSNFPEEGGPFDSGDFDKTVPLAHAPEPATLTLLGLGVAGLALRYRRRRSK